MLPATGVEHAIRVAERLRQLVEGANLEAIQAFYESVTGYKLSREALGITVSIGVVEFDPTCANLDVLIDQADRAMYLAKNEGRNRVKGWVQK
jgi:diguanylate cyclase (GGDEF)-like protein